MEFTKPDKDLLNTVKSKTYEDAERVLMMAFDAESDECFTEIVKIANFLLKQKRKAKKKIF